MSTPVVSVQAVPQDGPSWAALAARVEAAGYDALLAADHPGAVASPFVALAAAAAVTERIGLGSYVSQAGIREPLLLASDVATLDVLSGGRARLGTGAGHTPAEWAMLGKERPDVAGRVRRFVAVAETCRALLAGETVTLDGPEIRAHRARLTAPLPIQQPVPFTFGGGNSTLLRWAGKHADVVALSGLGRTLSDGHSHEARWNGEDIDKQVAIIEQGASGRATPPVREALVQIVEVTDDAEGAAHRLAQLYDTTAANVLESPYAWVGTAAEIAAAIATHERRWGITRYVVRERHLDGADRVFAHLSRGR
ncbi:flavin-dependent oxidoreductase, F420-dependent methylene-tetrahydromethanopterin reductase [Streptomyces noursei ATCC 11455]|uniref:LLM class flavin-dependent oxidoreductase n=1 Tax=Streptomyces noursei TaxID=1971 RepID=UPI00081D0D4A|nr:flavin-dependent oxidoreductase, F420-dependent methylene-tetrahydromethanopterin reductase [Streptomyces noursei ATCC 11455]